MTGNGSRLVLRRAVLMARDMATDPRGALVMDIPAKLGTRGSNASNIPRVGVQLPGNKDTACQSSWHSFVKRRFKSSLCACRDAVSCKKCLLWQTLTLLTYGHRSMCWMSRGISCAHLCWRSRPGLLQLLNQLADAKSKAATHSHTCGTARGPRCGGDRINHVPHWCIACKDADWHGTAYAVMDLELSQQRLQSFCCFFHAFPRLSA